jgi:hypothetical protein
MSDEQPCNHSIYFWIGFNENGSAVYLNARFNGISTRTSPTLSTEEWGEAVSTATEWRGLTIRIKAIFEKNIHSCKPIKRAYIISIFFWICLNLSPVNLSRHFSSSRLISEIRAHCCRCTCAATSQSLLRFVLASCQSVLKLNAAHTHIRNVHHILPFHSV